MTSMPSTVGEGRIDDIAIVIHQIAREHGFWDKPRNLGEMLMLATSELAEALEEDRDGMPAVWFKHTGDCHLINEVHRGFRTINDIQTMGPSGTDGCSCNAKPEGALVEIIDAIIRLLDTGQDLASRCRFGIGEVMSMKMLYNDKRPHMHGKKY